MSSEIRCDTSGCNERLLVVDDITQYTAAAIARAAWWLVLHGMTRDYHHCKLHGRSPVAIVLRFAAIEVRGEPRGIHAALRELDAAKIGDAVWEAYYAVKTETPGCQRDELLEAARRLEAEW